MSEVLCGFIMFFLCVTWVCCFFLAIWCYRGGAVKTESDDQILNKAYFDTAMQWLILHASAREPLQGCRRVGLPSLGVRNYTLS